MDVAPFKKGPDYIDAAWLGAATGRPGRNLDTFLQGPEALGAILARGASSDLALVEGNRGLFDGVDAAGTHSTAELAKRIDAPILLVVDVTKATRTVAALVLGLSRPRPRRPAGRGRPEPGGDASAGARHPRRPRRGRRAAGARRPAATRRGSPPGPPPGPGHRRRAPADAGGHRHRRATRRGPPRPGRRSWRSPGRRRRWTSRTRKRRREAPRSGSGSCATKPSASTTPRTSRRSRRSGPSSSSSPRWPGILCPTSTRSTSAAASPSSTPPGWPECRGLAESLRAAVAKGMPVYAECGGLMFLARELVTGRRRPPDGRRPGPGGGADAPGLTGHGYAEGTVERANPFFATGACLRGHEFHYSRPRSGASRSATVVGLGRGTGIGDGRDGIVSRRVWASYLHLHALGTPEWAPGLVGLARATAASEARGRRSRPHAAERGGQGVAAGRVETRSWSSGWSRTPGSSAPCSPGSTTPTTRSATVRPGCSVTRRPPTSSWGATSPGGCIWALNDESATNGVHGIPALGQIGRQAPDLVAPHVSALARMSWDHGLRLAILEALAEVARSSARPRGRRARRDRAPRRRLSTRRGRGLAQLQERGRRRRDA